MQAVKVSNLSVSYRDKKVFEKVSFTVPEENLIGILGPNGAGKSTLLKAILGFLEIDEGEIMIMNSPPCLVRKKMAYIPQKNNVYHTFPTSVEDVAMMGRYPHMTWYGWPQKDDYKAVSDALKQVNMFDLRKRQIGQLSGGQLQRVFIARALAQDAQILFLDEPFAGVDIASEEVIISLLRKLKEEGKTIFVVHHDLNTADKYFDLFLLLNHKLIAYGCKEEVFNPHILKKAYGRAVTSINQKEELMVVSN